MIVISCGDLGDFFGIDTESRIVIDLEACEHVFTPLSMDLMLILFSLMMDLLIGCVLIVVTVEESTERCLCNYSIR